jgi:hypothetical protein
MKEQMEKRQNGRLLTLAIVVTVLLVGVVLLGWYGTRKEQPSVVPVKEAASVGQAEPSAKSVGQNSHERAISSTRALNGIEYEQDKGIPYNTTILRLARDHPELGITLAEAVELQRVYSDYCVDRARLEVSIAKITQASDGQLYVEIPTYREQGQALLALLDQDVVQQFGSVRAPGISAAVDPLFSIDNHNLGAVSQELLVSNDPNVQNGYTVVHKMTMFDPASGAVSGSGMTVDNVTKGALGVYSTQPEFFQVTSK